MTTRRWFRDFLNPTFPFTSFLIAVLFILAGTTATIQAATIVVPAGGDLQSAINAAQPGDTIVVQAGATFVGSFYLPDKGPCSQCSYITIQSSAVNNLPSGTRVGPADAANMPKLVSAGAGIYGTSNQPVIGILPSAHHWKLVGLEVTPASVSNTVKSIVSLDTAGQGPANTAQIPHHIVIDRCYIHSLIGDTSVVRGIALNSTDSDVSNSYISEIHGISTDSQAIFSWNTPGRLIIDNNYLEAASECLQLGYTTADNIPPDNVSITRNHITRPLAWRGVYGNVKTLLEMKGGTNVRIDGNVFENNWADGQTGYAIVLSAWYNNIHNVSFTHNIVRHVGAGFSISGHGLSGTLKNVTVSDNLIDDINATTYNNPWNGTPAAGNLLAIGSSDYVTFNHNTQVNGGGGVSISGNTYSVAPHFTFTNNIIGYGGVGTFPIMRTIPQNSGTLQKTVVVGGVGNHSGTEEIYGYQDYAPVPPVPAWPQSTLYPSLNGTMLWFTENYTQVGFVDPRSNYRLAPTSLYKGKGTDGKDVGADFEALNAALGVSPKPSSAVSY